jgi:hypothetical protein
MNKLKLLVLTALAVAMVGIGALAAAPSASAQRSECAEFRTQSRINYNVYRLLVAAGYGETHTAAVYRFNTFMYDKALLKLKC